MFPMNRRPIPVAIEYTSRGRRVRKGFIDPFAARRFYAAKLAAGADPKVIAREEQVMAKTTHPKSPPAPKKPAAKAAAQGVGTTSRHLETLKSLSSGKPTAHHDIAKATGRGKGNGLRQLTEAGFVKTEKIEGVRGFLYTITAAGRKMLEKTGK